MDIEYHEEYVSNPSGVPLFTCRWLPASSSPKALVFLCHGYGAECSEFMRECGIKMATAGYGVFGIDYEGHGKSMGARCYIQKFDNLVTDCDQFFKSICDMEDYRNKSRFLYGESMGGAVVLLLHRKDPAFWDGAVLVAPMCKISEKVKPHPLVVSFLTKVEEIIPKWKIVPTKDIINSTFKDPIKREKVRKNKLIYQDRPRLKSALELLRTSMDVEDNLSEVRVPFLVLHGEADTVTDPEVSRTLYERSASTDKTIKLYPGMWHGLTAGEPDENVELVFSDILAWLDQRSRHWKPEERVRAPLEPESKHHQEASKKITCATSSNGAESPVPVSPHGQPQCGCSFLCGLGGQPNQHQSRM
ncbi:hypothetical protein SEVIR_3G278300v4 [Setaria viridis]|uniref:Serine aminopeptidase S33 domain-containing protein n=2 Tax=Setaria viridis TaxID=4556 RepID=A0A4U6VH34_SETVI|nr:caffeoylshikimate esterase-like isoform X1 [Setaria viridis]TKW27764.1 hypothetical protein SEVIR_3G278300v2 [Setaria viridis]